MYMKHATHTDQLASLKRIQGQVAGLIRMIEDERYCVDILTQTRAARAALKRVEQNVLRQHVQHCVGGAVEAGDTLVSKQKVDELFDVVSRYMD